MTTAMPCALGGPRQLLLRVCGWEHPMLRATAGLVTQGQPQGHGLQTLLGQGLHGGAGGGQAS